jgi:acylphosphatase
MTIARHFRIKGYVQGVGYRAFVCAHAQALGLAGFVRNRRDQTVEVLAQGSAAALDALLVVLHQGPPHGRVDEVEVLALDHIEKIVDFSILPTL